MKIKKYKRRVKNLYILLAFKYIKIQNLKLGNRYIKLQKGQKSIYKVPATSRPFEKQVI